MEENMDGLFINILFIFILILINGYLSGTEIAVVTARKSHIKQLAETGQKNAKIFLKLKEEPDRFLATIQIGITIVGVLASAIGGAAAIEVIKPVLQNVPIKAVSAASDPLDRNRRRYYYLFFFDFWGIGAEVNCLGPS